ncbi:MAG: DHH family phosphoesterase [Clostridium sp.]|nr:DHH family phosphoesterase [Clostridium sp.]
MRGDWVYNLIGENDLKNAREQILRNRGITEALLNVGEESVEDYMNYDNIIEGCKLLMKHIEVGNEICVLIDCDSDGITSSALLVNYLYREFPTINLVLKHHSGKQHGLSDKNIKIDNGIKLVVVPDAGTNDLEEIEELYSRNIEVLVLDHHELEAEYPKYGILINNQTSKRVKNKSLSGVGIVYKFLCAFSEYYYLDSPHEFIDIVALGNIADVMDAKSPETRYYIKEGLKNIKNPFIKALIKEKEFDMDGKINMTTIGWNISPLLNGCIRSGRIIEKEKLYTVMITNKDCEGVARICKNAKARQDSAVKNSMVKIEKTLKINEEDKVIIASSCGASKSQTGLIAGKLASKYKKPTFLYSNEDEIVKGSARGLGNINLKEDLINSGLASGIGHSLAFGFEFKHNDIEKIRGYFNKLYKDVDFGSTGYEVDFELTAFDIYQEFVDEIASMEDEWGNGLNAPLIAIKDFCLELNNNNLKGKTNVVWNIYGIKCVKKFTSKVWKEEFLNKKTYVDIIGRCILDTYSGKGCIEVVDVLKIN